MSEYRRTRFHVLHSRLRHEERYFDVDIDMSIKVLLGDSLKGSVAHEPRVQAEYIEVSSEGFHALVNEAQAVGHLAHVALNDYTVTQRGDVGSLVRLEALTTIGTAWSTKAIEGSTYEQQLQEDTLRLSLEKLDKVRGRAAQVFEQGNHQHFEGASKGHVDGISSYTYFSSALHILKSPAADYLKEAMLLGFISSAGMGSESVVQNSRSALLDAIDTIPTTSSDDGQAHISLLKLSNCMLDWLKVNLEEERVLIPLMDVLAFLFDMQVMHRLIPTTFK